PPFQGDFYTLVAQVSLDPPPIDRHLPGLDPRLKHICLKALAKQPGDRWHSMRDLADALGAFLAPPASQRSTLADPPVPLHPGVLPGPLLTLRIEGTPFAYRPLPGQD